jgi:transketolase
MGMADLAEVLWRDNLKHNPANSRWADRDRFVLSNGHGSMLLYSLLHLTGYDLPMEELRNFRQLHSRTPGHPEFGETPGVETTTGPLGQGLANAVGMALAEKVLAQRFNRGGHRVVDHHTWVFLGDGCLMEGISHETCSLAGKFGLGKLIAFWDDNGISIDGEVAGWFIDDTPARFEAYGWQVIRAVDGHDPVEIQQAIDTARAETERPTLICARTVIGYGSPNKQGTESTHGAPLGEDEVSATRENLGWPHAPFEVPQDIRSAWDAREAGAVAEAEWQDRFEAYRRDFAGLAEEFERRMSGALPDEWAQRCQEIVTSLQAEAADVATRKSSQIALNALGPMLPELIGGSADLAGSNNTIWSGSVDVNRGEQDGNYVYFGVREFGMTAICNGLALHGGFIPYNATFLVFSDYARNAVRMSALLPVRNIHVYTHDSIGLGEDGPTHQPIEHVASLRLIPGLEVWRPCDTVETVVAWKAAIESDGRPTALVLSRQGLPQQDRTDVQLENVERGGYVLTREDGPPAAVIIATGSEVGLAMEAARELTSEGTTVRVVSMPNPGRFLEQDSAYRDSVVPPGVGARLVVEAGVGDCWAELAGSDGIVLGVNRFGASAPGDVLFQHYGLTVTELADAVREMLGGAN